MSGLCNGVEVFDILLNQLVLVVLGSTARMFCPMGMVR